jgi:hypothetical protein
MNLIFMDHEIPLLKALVKLGGSASPAEVFPEEEGFNGIGNVRIHETGNHRGGKRSFLTETRESFGSNAKFSPGFFETHRLLQEEVKHERNDSNG